MRFAVAVLMVILFSTLIPVSAQATYTEGMYEFENEIASMTYFGTWTTTNTFSVVSRQTSVASSEIDFLVSGGKTLVIWRRMVQSTGNTAQTCLFGTGGYCVIMTNDTTTSQYWYPLILSLPTTGTYTISILRTGGTINLDSFMVLGDPASSMPTAVPTIPTATILPSSTPAPTVTPAYTATPGPTPVNTATPMNTPVNTATAAPSVTPYTLPAAIIAISPNTVYDTVNGQIVAIDYTFSAGDIAIIIIGAFGVLMLLAHLVMKMGER